MKILKYIFLPFVFIIDFFNYQSHLENYKFSDNYDLYETPKWIDNYYKGLK